MITNRFPFPQQLRTILSNAGVTEYDANTVFAYATKLFRVWDNFESLLNVSANIVAINTQPSYILDRLTNDLSAMFRSCLVKILIHKRISDASHNCFYLGSTDKDENEVNTCSVSMTLEDIVVASKQISALEHAKIHGQTTILFDFEDIMNEVDWDSIKYYPELSIKKAYYSTITRSDRVLYTLCSFRFGSAFIDTINNLKLNTQLGKIRTIYETCALIACNYAPQVSGINPRPLRGHTRTTDGAKGMRADISKHRAGYRIHYWKCPDGCIEFSCVNTHNDITIY